MDRMAAFASHLLKLVKKLFSSLLVGVVGVVCGNQGMSF